MRRVPIESIGDEEHGQVSLEGSESALLPRDRVYIVPSTGQVLDGRNGHRLKDLPEEAIELPRTTWY